MSDDQIQYEIEVATGDEIYKEFDNLQTRGNKCEKNPGHTEFYSVEKSKLSHSLSELPSKFQTDRVLKWIEHHAALTVLVIPKKISLYRPDKFPSGDKKGEISDLVGTGYCTKIIKCVSTAGEDSQKCPCLTCEQSGQPKSSWWEVTVQTAVHVVYDDTEANGTDVIFFFDDTGSKTVTIQGHKVDYTNQDKDDCHLVCLAHDVSELEKIIDYPQTVPREYFELSKEYGDEWDNQCVIISHPHGSTKQITFGTFITNDKESGLSEYDTPTCKGSSGARVPWKHGFLSSPGFPHIEGGKLEKNRGKTGKFKHSSNP